MKNVVSKIGVSIMAVGILGSTGASIVKADAAPGDVIVTLGENLSIKQKDKLFDEMKVAEKDVDIVYVSNEEEHKYLGKYIPKSQIGSKAISSAKITLGEKNTGLIVETDHINYITNDMYLNALSTAGVKDAKVYITAPFDVSGTGALTGIIKAYEVSSGKKIDEEQKQIANEEMVTTAKLAENKEVGQEKAADFMNQIKKDITAEKPEKQEELRAIIKKNATEMEVPLTKEEEEQLVSLFDKIKGLNINWEKVNETLGAAKEKWNNFVNSDEGKSIIHTFTAFVKSLWNGFISLFK
ncbi:DUF1002 domain-containing protein [Bacillus toyonensis]|uniref:DUF1002 domain-containing protein n=1 Tax=Bacillus toyonensis TaxID=155322 RepID=UPI002E1C7DB9|nr:DUF1002 domain-containing protein [Bacillus toyonensis]